MILTGTNLVTPALRWTLPYLEENIGTSKHTVYISKSHTFMYFDDKKVDVSVLLFTVEMHTNTYIHVYVYIYISVKTICQM